MSDFPYLKIKHYINGAWKEETGVKTEPLYNPSTGDVICEVPMASSEQTPCGETDDVYLQNPPRHG